MNNTWQTKELKELFKTLAKFKNAAEIAAFMRDIATIQELEEMSARWKAAQLINKKVSYRAIAKNTGLSTTTIARVGYWLKYGEGGYRKALNFHHNHASFGKGMR